jgi:hypothetical protein
MRLVSLILLIAIVVLLMEHHFKKVEDAYHRGHIDGIASVKKPNLDNVCAAWWYGSNLIDAKKRLCER